MKIKIEKRSRLLQKLQEQESAGSTFNELADDLLIMSTASEGLQNSFNKLSNYCKEWGIDVNAQKSNIIDFGRKKNNDRIMFTLNNSQIKCVNNYNYLGFNINSNSKFYLLQKTLVNKASRALFSLYKMSGFKNFSITQQFQLYDSLIKPILTYRS